MFAVRGYQRKLANLERVRRVNHSEFARCGLEGPTPELLLATNMARGRPPNLKRRRLIAKLRAKGLTYRQIGERLGISRQCVQQTLRYCEKARLVPIRCKKCGDVIARMRTVHNSNGPVYCLGCLPRNAPFGQRLRAYRVVAELTQGQLAALTRVTPTTIHGWERSRRKPIPVNVRALSAVLGAGLNRAS
jgi:transcriptional regulator with XRE-family HTH domain